MYELWRRVGRNSRVPGGGFRIFKIVESTKLTRYSGERDGHISLTVLVFRSVTRVHTEQKSRHCPGDHRAR